MARIHVEVTEEYLANLIKNPRKGVDELIDNALDADARNINVELARGPLEAITRVTVSDDGEGMTRARAASAFGNLGDSWKRQQPRTRTGRRRRGSKGHGRWAAFALGNDVTWTSVAAAAVGEGCERVVVAGNRRDLDGFDVSDEPERADGPTGTVVVVRDVHDNAQVIDGRGETERLTNLYATLLRRHPSLRITFDGTALDPDTVTVETVPIDLPLGPDADEGAARLTVVQWRPKVRGVRPTLVLAGADGEGLHDHTDFLPRAPWQYTAYLSWDGFTSRQPELPAPVMWDDETRSVVDAALEALREHIESRKVEAQAALIERWKDENSYPYHQAPRGPIEEAERDLFDLVAVTAAPAIEASEPKGRKFALRMLREAITRDPSDLTEVLAQVLDLDEDELADLAQLLRRTSLSSLLNAGREVVRRLDILDDLHSILHDPKWAPKVGEKQHLHEIVAAEPWVFGDEYTTAVSERALTAVLTAHQRILGDDRLVVDPTAAGPRPTVGGLDGRIDLMLSRVAPIDEGIRQHLIVELKRPSVTLGIDEITQLKKYAFEIRKDPRFHGQEVRWDFLLIGAKMDDQAREEEEAFARAALPNFEVRVITWDRLIHQRRHQMKFVREALNLATSESGDLAQIRELHHAHLPEAVLNSPTP